LGSATAVLFTLSLHDALPILSSRLPPTATFGVLISCRLTRSAPSRIRPLDRQRTGPASVDCWAGSSPRPYPTLARRHRLHDLVRSEEHTSELQSRENLVCRLL